MAECAHLHAGLFTMQAETIAESLSSKEVSPQGASSGLRLLTFYMNYAGRWLSASRRRNLEKAKKLLSIRLAKENAEREQQEQGRAA
ncbi:MAG: DUF3175 domain-containing protein [Acidobacteriota bacterium]